MQLKSVVQCLENIAPLGLAEPWDNVGLLTGDPTKQVQKLMLTIDATQTVLDEARAHNVDLLVSYHPLLLKPLARLAPKDPLYLACRADIAVYSPHTALDAAAGGTNEVLAGLAGVATCEPLVPHQQTLRKLTVFVPPENHAAVADAVHAAGAGNLGNYSRCSFVTKGYGSFVPDAAATPTTGRRGEPTRTDEHRLEVLLRPQQMPAVLTALRQAHPYEAPVYDVVQLVGEPGATGQGRVGELQGPAQDISIAHLVERLRRATKLHHISFATAERHAKQNVRRLAFAAGAGDGLMAAAQARGAQVLVTGELRHHNLLACLAAGISVILLGHDNSERPALRTLQHKLAEQLQGIDVTCSAADRSPVEVAHALQSAGL